MSLNRFFTAATAAIVTSFAIAVVPGAAHVGVATASAATTAPSDGLLIGYMGFVDGTGTVRDTGLPGIGHEFSPDGAMIAGVAADSGPDGSTVWVATTHHVVTELAPVLGEVLDISWSGDQSQLAVLSRDGYDVTRLYRVPLDGTNAVLLVADTPTFHFSQSEISWNPQGAEIAFIATPTSSDGSYFPSEGDQIYTVSASGGAPSHFNAVFDDPGCRADISPGCEYFNYGGLDWSPDGSRIGVLVHQEQDYYGTGGSNNAYLILGTVTRGATRPATVRTVTSCIDYTACADGGVPPILWSADGTRLMYEDIQSTGVYVPTIVSVATGAVVGTHPFRHDFTDRQPCPTGTCAVWPLAVVRATAKLAGYLPTTAWTYGSRPVATGTLTIAPAQFATGSVSLIVDGTRRATAQLTAAMKNVFKFRLPTLKVGKHTIQLRYGGSTLVEPASTGTAHVRVIK